MAANGGAIGRIDEQPERGEIVLDLVDGVLGPRRRGPVQLRATRCGRLALELLVVRNLADNGAHDVEDVERRHARAGAADVEARIGQPQPIRCCTDRETEQEPFGLGAIFQDGEVRPDAGAERCAHVLVEEERILAQLLRKEPLGQSGHEHDFERAAACLVRAADEHAPVAVGRRLLVERPQAFGQHVASFLERDWTDGAHRAQLTEHAQYPRRPAQHSRGKLAESLEPFAPGRLRGPRRERLDNRDREVREMGEVLAVALEAGELRRLRVLAQPFLADLRLIALAQPAQPPPPAFGIAADDRRLHNQPFPLPRRAEPAFHDGGQIVGVNRVAIGYSDDSVSIFQRSRGPTPARTRSATSRLARAAGAPRCQVPFVGELGCVRRYAHETSDNVISRWQDFGVGR